MSLKVITDSTELKKNNIKVVNYNDIFFQSVSLENNDLTEKIMSTIDKAHYSSKDTFTGRDESLGRLNKSLLSTGCKTLLNIAYNPNTCFDVRECGPNALEALKFIDNGMIFWENPILFLTKEEDCNIEYNNKQYSKFGDFLNEVMN